MYATNFVFCALSEHINRKKADVGIDKNKRDNAFLFGDLFTKGAPIRLSKYLPLRLKVKKI